MADWVDGSITEQTGHQQFHAPVAVEELLSEVPDSIWPVLMPCDLLPVLGNNAGDYLCLRMDQHNRISEIVHWYHGGGDWIPWAKTLPDAIVFGHVLGCLPRPTKDHAIAAEDPRPSIHSDLGRKPDPLLEWAIRFVAPDVRKVVDQTLLLGAELPRHDLAESWLDVLERNGVACEAIALRRIQIISEGRMTEADWRAMQSIAEKVGRHRTDLAWPMNVAADAALRLGNRELAAQHYHSALACSNFTDQSVRLGMHWDAQRSSKYAAYRIVQNGLFDPRQELHILFCDGDGDHNGSTATKDRVRDYWLKQSALRERDGDRSSALRCAVLAAWDMGLDSMNAYRPILMRVVSLAESTDQFARAEVARTHLTSFEQRYG